MKRILCMSFCVALAAPVWASDAAPPSVVVERSAVSLSEVPSLLEAWTGRSHQGKGVSAFPTLDIFVDTEVAPEELAGALYALLDGAGHGTQTNKKGATTIGGKGSGDLGDAPVVVDNAKLEVKQIQAPPGRVIQAVSKLVSRPVLVYYGGARTPQILRFQEGRWTKTQLWSQLQEVLRTHGAKVGGHDNFLLVWFP
jgi:hypothetical protein